MRGSPVAPVPSTESIRAGELVLRVCVHDAGGVDARGAEVPYAVLRAVEEVIHVQSKVLAILPGEFLADPGDGPVQLLYRVARFSIAVFLDQLAVGLLERAIFLLDQYYVARAIHDNEIDLAVHGVVAVFPAPVDAMEDGVIVGQRLLQQREGFDFG
jgi:hypothetical protein